MVDDRDQIRTAFAQALSEAREELRLADAELAANPTALRARDRVQLAHAKVEAGLRAVREMTADGGGI